jgi:hypothetical protein
MICTVRFVNIWRNILLRLQQHLHMTEHSRFLLLCRTRKVYKRKVRNNCDGKNAGSHEVYASSHVEARALERVRAEWKCVIHKEEEAFYLHGLQFHSVKFNARFPNQYLMEYCRPKYFGVLIFLSAANVLQDACDVILHICFCLICHTSKQSC